MHILAAIFVLSYLLGSIPWAIIISRKVKGIDIREHGSGNAGGTNVFRILGWKYGLLVIVLDAVKGALAVLLVARLYLLQPVPINNPSGYFEDFTIIQVLAGIFAVIGHIWSVFAKFKGGKGIATGLGMLLSITSVDMLIGLGIFILIVTLTKYVSLGSLLAAISVPISLIIRQNLFHAEIQGYGIILPFISGVVLLVIYTHRKNIVRIFQGRENKISFSKKSS